MTTETTSPTADAEAIAETPPQWTPQPGKALVLRTTDSQGRAARGFTWPTEGPVTCPDWEPTAECGHGLHGLLWGAGDGGLLSWSDGARWLVVEVDTEQVVSLGRKVKFPAGVVVYCGKREAAVSLIGEHAPDRAAVVGLAHTATGDYGHAAATGDYGHAAATGYSGHAAATGRSGIAAALGGGSATAGEDGVVIARWTDKQDRPRVTVGYVGEDGIEAGTAYKCDEDGKLVPASSVPTNKALTGDLIGENKACKVINLALERAKRDAAKTQP